MFSEILKSLHNFSEKNKHLISGLLVVLLLVSGGLSVNLLTSLEIESETVKNKLIASAVLAGVSALLIVLHLYYKNTAIVGVVALASAIASFALQFDIKDDIVLSESQSSQFWASYWIGVGSSVGMLTFLVGLHSGSTPAEKEIEGVRESIEKLPSMLERLKSKILQNKPTFEKPDFGKVYAPSSTETSEASEEK
jgi:hypothetical protein